MNKKKEKKKNVAKMIQNMKVVNSSVKIGFYSGDS
ncbi:hypothetical protein NEF87_003515 [Candidatus Lokiarchaeum ossiferum]|uniref:Uncharacterized protein n=1 Tax=Candidatus Lokiarchaeum ossiferum TaxID=2951803 RepID=A0ABY6HUN2_9ARCH|nr:hypothetical protein NEF87_003515 [Candidatus Lokiarchaeum sp. B-35]